MKGTLYKAKATLTKAKDDMARYYNQRRIPSPVYLLGDKVFLDSSNIKTTQPSQKLAHQYLGPFPVVHATETVSKLLLNLLCHFCHHTTPAVTFPM